MDRRISALFVACLCTLVSCGGGGGGGIGGGGGDSGNFFGGPDIPTAPGPGVFTFAPMDLTTVQQVISIGWLQPVGHTLPTDHAYFYLTTNESGQTPTEPIYAPGAGWVTMILNTDASNPDSVDWKVMIQMTPTFVYYLDTIVPDPSLKVGDYVAAGQQIGQTEGGGAIDLGVADAAVTVPFISPARYGIYTDHCASPFKYFSSALQSQVYALVDRAGADKDGTICYDQAGTLAGNWFEQSVPANAGYITPAYWPDGLSFAWDPQVPTQMEISIGGVLCDPGKFKPAPTAPDFRQVTAASGVVAYPLLFLQTGSYGLMICKLLDAKTLEAEVFPGSSATTGSFDANAHIYKR